MTATSVNGVAVLSDEPTPAPITSRDGRTVLWQQTRTLLLADGTTTYGCVHCTYTSRNPHSIRPHLGKHRVGLKPLAAAAGTQVLASLEELINERDDWRERALAAEKRLRNVRKGLGLT